MRWLRLNTAWVARAALALLVLSTSVISTAEATSKPHKGAAKSAAVEAAPKNSSIVLDADTGRVLTSVDPDQQNYPASLTKMMTLYVTFQQLAQRRISLNQTFMVSEYAASMAPSKLDLRPGQSIRLEDAILALCTKSANDVAVVLAEGLGGNEENFAHIMTQTAAKLGMTRTHFANASGLPDNEQLTTARDMATLGLALIRDFPQFYPYFNTRTFAYKGEVITNHNHLLGAVDGVDGIKTGFIRASGFNLVASAKRDGHRIVAVVLGGTTPALRDRQMTHLLDEGFAEIEMRNDNPVVANAETPQNAPHFRPSSYHSAPAMADLSVAADGAAQNAQGDSESDGDRAAAAMRQPPPGSVQVASNDIMMPATSWAIQVGAFASDQAARAAAVKAERQAHRWLQSGKIQIGLSAGSTSAVFRARINGLDQKQAAAACRVLLSQGTKCLALPDQL